MAKPSKSYLREVRTRHPELPARFVLIDVARQQLLHIDHDHIRAHYPISTAAGGIGNRSGSMQTPPGMHCVAARIGAQAPSGTIFEGRVDTGKRWQGDRGERDLILSRILRLEGLQPGINRGPGIDSFERYIYIHGTNHEERIGTPCSHGCIRMRNDDIIDLFEQISEDDVVYIDSGH